MGAVKKIKEVGQKAVKTMKKIINAIKFFVTPLGTVLAWILFIIFALLLMTVIVETIATAFKDFFNFNTNYSTFDQDMEVIKDLYNSGYSTQLDPENFVDFKSFEYAVLMDASEYIRVNGQEEFDIVKNQSLYLKELKLYKEMYKGRYNELTGENEKPQNPVVKLLDTVSKTDQSKVEGDVLKAAIEQGTNSRNIDVIDFAGLGKDENKTTKGGNNRVMGPFLVYEFVYNDLSTKSTTDDSAGKGDLNYADEPDTSEDLFNKEEIGGSVIPYLYVIREEIEFSYYFDKNNNAIEIPFLLNAYNNELAMTTEWRKEISRVTRGIPAAVWPDRNMDKESGDYTWVPYYSDETNCTIYKIPMKTILGRYLPRTELLHAWTMLKQNIVQDPSLNETDKNLEFINNITNKIKQIYNDTCLKDESTEHKEKTVKVNKLNKRNEVETKSVEHKYEYDTSNKTTFATFEKAGIETTRYVDFNDADVDEIKYVSNFVSALIIDEEFTISYVTQAEPTQGHFTQTAVDVKSTANTTTMSISSLGISDIKYGEILVATGTMEDGYIPPSSLHDFAKLHYCSGTEDDIPNIRGRILSAACSKLGVSPEVASISINIEYRPIFITSTISCSKTLEIEHRRMPILLVKSAITWAREIEYSHEIQQSMFEESDASYIIPNSVSSMGIQSFVTREIRSEYRGKAYEETFGFLQEKDVISMLLTLETAAEKGNSDCYEYMRELYKLVRATQEYSQTSKHLINPDTYTYVYLQDSILYYDDAQTQKIYWQELLGQRGSVDALTKEEIENMRSRDPVLKWQIVEYEKYPECNNKVYALNPYGSAYVRAHAQLAIDMGASNIVSGAYVPNSHEGADLYGRNRIDSMLNKKSVPNERKDITNKIYNYALKQLELTYGTNRAQYNLKQYLAEELSYMPIVAVAPGKVVGVNFNGRSGFCVTIAHNSDGSVRTLYCHLKRWPNVNVGDHVGAGTVIGYEGNTGRSGGTHLHFEITKVNPTGAEISSSGSYNPDKHTVNPENYIYPLFNPFYNEEKAKEDSYALSSEYMTLYRTVYLAEDGTGNTEVGGKLENKVPKYALLNNVEQLVGDIGKRDRKLNMSGSLDWTPDQRNDLYLREEYFDLNKARTAGLLELDNELYTVLFGYIPVKTDMPGALPALTREELEYILKNWLSARYKEEEFNWLMENVFTEDTIVKILEAQEQYQVSAVFALAVGTLEQQLGLSYYRDSNKFLGKPGIHNIFSIKGSLNGGVSYINAIWNVYDSYGDAFAAFAKLIAGKKYFEAGKFTIAAIGPTYCPTGEPPGASWSRQVTVVALQIMQYYTGSKWSSNLTFVDNSEFLGIARNFITLLANAGYDYGYSVTDFNPFTNEIEGSSKQIDCTAYVSGVIRAYGKMHNIPELQTFNEGSSGFCSFANSIANGKTTGAEKYFEVIWIRRNKDYQHPDGSEPTLAWLQENMLPGDIIVFYAGHSRRTADKHIVEYGITAKGICSKCPVSLRGKNGAHHAEIFTGGWEKGKSSVFSCGSGPGTDKDFYAAYSKGEPVWNRCLFSTAKTGNTRYTLYAIIRLKSEM